MVVVVVTVVAVAGTAGTVVFSTRFAVPLVGFVGVAFAGVDFAGVDFAGEVFGVVDLVVTFEAEVDG